MDFATGEIEPRLALPVAWEWLAVERILAAAARGALTAVLMVALGAALLGGLGWCAGGVVPAAGIVVLGVCCGGALGTGVGATVPSRRIGIAFAVVMPPLLFTGVRPPSSPSVAGRGWRFGNRK